MKDNGGLTKLFLHILLIILHSAIVMPFFIGWEKSVIFLIVFSVYHIIVLPLAGLFVTPINELVEEHFNDQKKKSDEPKQTS